MPQPPMSEYEQQRRIEAYEAAGRSLKQAATALGMSVNTLKSTITAARRLGLVTPKDGPWQEPRPSFIPLPENDIPADEIIRRAAEDFEIRRRAQEAKRWFRITMPSNRPIGVAFVGDPHVDDSGCNWPLLSRHLQLLEQTDGLYAVGGNDLTNNWVGRLVRLYAEQNMGRDRAWKLVKHLLVDSDVRWLWHHPGNHDEWNDGIRILEGIVKQAGKKATPVPPILSGDSRVELAFPNGNTVKVWHRHDFAGNSQYNRLHGNQKAALWGEQADIYASAHLHSWAMHQEEHEHRGNIYWLVRSRGYKFIDKYAEQLGFGQQKHGATITAIIDPTKDGPRKIHCYADMEEAAEYLTWLRSGKRS